jgi:glycosyltransferase involved in cell wall biosynthesis
LPRILLLSAYHADSHQYWCEGLITAFPSVDWTLLTLPPRYFSWRIRGNSLTWALSEGAILAVDYDLVIATSMVDLAGLRGLVPSLGQVPTLVYFHENQFAYPRSDHQHPSIEPQMVNLYSALCGDRVVFNSHYNLDSFLGGVNDLLRRLPDGVPGGVVERLAARAQVIPVPLDDTCYRRSEAGGPNEPLSLVWNHRWEYDKGPDRLLAALRQVPDDVPLLVHVVGQQFRREPEVMGELKAFLQQRGSLGCWGYVDSHAQYQALLQRSHGVLSTALHDFQGVAVLEAVAAGCVPLVPSRLVYPEWFGGSNCYASCASIEEEAKALAAAIVGLAQRHEAGRATPAPDVERFRWRQCRDLYAEVMAKLSKAF